MAGRDSFTFHVTVPAGTPVAAPVTIDTSFPPRIVREIRWRVPPGAAGLMGFRITSGGVQVLPVTPGTWIIAAGESGAFPGDGLHDSGKWDVTAYNTGVFPHTIHVTFHCEVIGRAPESFALFADSELSRWPTFEPVRGD